MWEPGRLCGSYLIMVIKGAVLKYQDHGTIPTCQLSTLWCLCTAKFTQQVMGGHALTIVLPAQGRISEFGTQKV